MRNGLKNIGAALKGAERVLITTHVNPDGDAIGSAAALAHVVLHLGGQVRLFLYDPLPDFLRWLPLPCPVLHTVEGMLPPYKDAANAEGAWRPDCVAFVDCADARRSGSAFATLLTTQENRPLMLNIDHHSSNAGFADVNWVEPGRAATGELVGLLAESFDVSLAGDLGSALYLALVSDTGGFSYSNTGSEVLALASRIVAAGLDMADFTAKYENNWSLARLHLWGRLMQEVALHHDGAVAVSKAPIAYLAQAGLGKDALEGFASWLRKIAGVRVGLFLREDAPGLTKISLRSMGDVNVAAVAALFGGGGHMAAAGAEVNDNPDTVANMVLEALGKQMELETP